MNHPRPAPMPGAENLAEPLRSRWSPRIFDPTHTLADHDVEQLLRAAQWAPSWGNTQPWRFVVLRRDGVGHDVLVRHLSPGNDTWVPHASVVFLAAAQIEPDPAAGPDGYQPDPDYARYDLGQAVAHLTLQARAMGLEAHQIAGFDQAATAAEVGVPSFCRVFSAVVVGHAGNPEDADPALVERDARPRVRHDLPLVAFEGAYGNGWRPTP